MKLRPLVIALVVIAPLAGGSAFTRQQYNKQSARLGRERASLRAEQMTVAGLERALHAIELRTRDVTIRQRVEHTEAERIRADIVSINRAHSRTVKTQTSTAKLLTETEVRNAVVAGAAAVVDACLTAERDTASAIQHGDQAAATAALNRGAQPCASALAAASGARFPYDFPDPFVLTTDSGYVAYSTNGSGGNVQVLRSDDLVTWAASGDALGGLPAWAVPGATWAPAVLHLSALPATPFTPARTDHYVMYFTARETASGASCIGSATSNSPTGPFVDDEVAPLVCDRPDGGSIDPEAFIDADGTPYLYWKRERAIRAATLMAQPLGFDGRSLVGNPVEVLAADQSWERGVVEAPSMVRDNKHYWLLFSGGIWNEHSYAEGVAACDGPLGPCHVNGGPTLATNGTTVSPGGAAAFVDANGNRWIAYHAYNDPFVGWPYSRTLRLAHMNIGGNSVSFRTP